MTDLLHSGRVKKWLSQFAPADKTPMMYLLEALRFVSSSQFQRAMVDHIGTLASTCQSPIALVPIREMGETESYFGRGRSSKALVLDPVAYPGSEAIVAQILT